MHARLPAFPEIGMVGIQLGLFGAAALLLRKARSGKKAVNGTSADTEAMSGIGNREALFSQSNNLLIALLALLPMG